MTIVVYKLGGSLLDLPDLPQRLAQIAAQRPTARPLLVVGGGAAADLVRHWDRLHRLGNDAAHWLAIEAMHLNACLLHELLPGSQLVATLPPPCDSPLPAERSEPRAAEFVLLNVPAFLRRSENEGHRLPASWEVTSDSIAAWVTIACEATELVLLKSCPPPPGVGMDKAIQSGWIDRYFAQLHRRLPRISWVNLRDASPQICRWLPAQGE